MLWISEGSSGLSYQTQNQINEINERCNIPRGGMKKVAKRVTNTSAYIDTASEFLPSISVEICH